jgi:formylglycine-generating enzyme required for sulfatase activity
LEDRFGITFVYVSPGEFPMGSTRAQVDAAFELCRQDQENCNNYRSWFERQMPQHRVNLDGFWIGETEVTNAQYRPFVEAGGYQRRELWTDVGWQWREENGITQPGCWYDGTWNQPDHPVVCVSWYEAVAYTRWLAQETGVDVRLPTEAQWEKAARGADARTWPWGNEPPDGARLNYCDRNCEHDWKDETVDDGYRYTAPAGSYPAGASPYGVLDMAGNVWEWTSSLYRDYPYWANDGREDITASGSRILRGGAWFNDRHWAPCAFRNWDNATTRHDEAGFRCCAIAASSP